VYHSADTRPVTDEVKVVLDVQKLPSFVHGRQGDCFLILLTFVFLAGYTTMAVGWIMPSVCLSLCLSVHCALCTVAFRVSVGVETCTAVFLADNFAFIS